MLAEDVGSVKGVLASITSFLKVGIEDWHKRSTKNGLQDLIYQKYLKQPWLSLGEGKRSDFKLFLKEFLGGLQGEPTGT